MRSNSCISWQISFKFCVRCIFGKNLDAYCFWWRCPQCSVFYRVKGHILVHILVCTLHVTAAFLDGFLSNFVWKCIIVNSTRLLFWWRCPSVPSFIGSKVIFWFILVCTLHVTAAFLDGFLSNFLWKCIIVNSTRLLFWWRCPSVPSVIGSNVIFWLNFTLLCAL